MRLMLSQTIWEYKCIYTELPLFPYSTLIKFYLLLYLYQFISLLENKSCDWLMIMKTFAEKYFNVAQMMISVFQRVENTVEKAEHAGYQYFLLFPQCFQKCFYVRVVETCDSVVKGF